MQALLAHLPALSRALPRVDLRVRETPVEDWVIDGVSMMAKRDDLTAAVLGGNKVRALELLLAGVGPDHALLTVGPTGSTHALAVAQYGARLGAPTTVITWPQPVHGVAAATGSRLARVARVVRARSPVDAYLRAGLRRLRGGITWVPAGGSTALGALGHAAAAIEVVAQLARDGRPLPHEIVAPLGSGGTVAGLLAGLALVAPEVRVIGVRVTPRLIANPGRVMGLARRTHALLQRLASEPLPPLPGHALEVDERSYGGGYAVETDEAQRAAALLVAYGGPPLDGTYSAKAFACALARARAHADRRVMFWLTFDGRWLAANDDVREPETGTT